MAHGNDAQSQREFDEFQMLNEKTIETSHLYLKSVLLINGGAAVAVLGFLASLARVEEDLSRLFLGVSEALMWFAWGVLSAAGAIALAYFTNYANLFRMHNRGTDEEHFSVATKRIMHILALAVAASPLAFFFFGASAVRDAVVSFWGNP